MLDGRIKLYLSKGVKYICGYQNTALYDFNKRKVFLISYENGRKITKNGFHLEDNSLVIKLVENNLVTSNLLEADPEPAVFDYELFDDCHSGDSCKLFYIEITDKCNFNCIHCYADIQRSGTKFMSPEQVDRIIDHLPSTSPCDIRITGGEPFINPDIREILHRVNSRMKPIHTHSVVTNGSFSYDDAIYALSMGYELQVSIYGITPESFEKFTNSSRKHLQAILERLKKISHTPYKDKVLLCFAVNAITYLEIQEFEDFCNTYGFRFIHNRPASIGRAVANWNELQLSKHEHYDFSRKTKSGPTRYCYHLCQLHLTVADVNGNIIPCCFLRDPKFYFGNIFCDTLQNIWDSKKYHKFRDLTAVNVDKCSQCEFAYVCTAGCCGEAEGNNKDILATYPWCSERPFERKYQAIGNHEVYQAEKLAAGTFDFKQL